MNYTLWFHQTWLENPRSLNASVFSVWKIIDFYGPWLPLHAMELMTQRRVIWSTITITINWLYTICLYYNPLYHVIIRSLISLYNPLQTVDYMYYTYIIHIIAIGFIYYIIILSILQPQTSMASAASTVWGTGISITCSTWTTFCRSWAKDHDDLRQVEPWRNQLICMVYHGLSWIIYG